MLYPAAGAHPVIDVRKLVLSVEDVWHDGGPRNATPLRRGSIAAILHNPYAGEYVADIQPMMEALKPLGREMAQRLIGALGGTKAIEGYGKGALIGLDGEIDTVRYGTCRAVMHARPARGLACDRAVDDQDRRRRRDHRHPIHHASRPTCAATSTAPRCASPTVRVPTNDGSCSR